MSSGPLLKFHAKWDIPWARTGTRAAAVTTTPARPTPAPSHGECPEGGKRAIRTIFTRS